jgi:hypothetical protein
MEAQLRFGCGLRCRFCLLRYSGGQLASKRHHASSGRLEELLDLLPICSGDVIRAAVSARCRGLNVTPVLSANRLLSI